jgi:hypothetical protein
MSVIYFDIPRALAVFSLLHFYSHSCSDHHVCFTVVFAFDCIVFMHMTAAFSPDDHPVGFIPHTLSWILAVVVPLLTLEQSIASVLIAPKHKSTTDRKSPETAMLGLKLYLIGIGIQELLVGCTIVLAVKTNRNIGNSKGEHTPRKSFDQVSPTWRSISYALLFSLAALATRIAYRLVELSGIFTGYLLVLMHNEVFFYTLECLPVLAALGVWTCVDTQSLSDEQSSNCAPGDAYSYHEVDGELVNGETILLERGSVEH